MSLPEDDDNDMVTEIMAMTIYVMAMTLMMVVEVHRECVVS